MHLQQIGTALKRTYARLRQAPPWADQLPEQSRAIVHYCVGKIFPVDGYTEEGDIILDVSAEVDDRFGGYANDLRVEPEYLDFVDGV